MNEVKYFFIAILIFLFSFNVNAIEYNEMDLIPVDTVATVQSENFDYIDFQYVSAVNEKGNAVINFGSIGNKSADSRYISVDILMFDAEKKNIGFLTYCTDQDYSSNYSDFKLGSGEAIPFQINVVAKKYFAEKKSPADVKYIAVMDDNKYCHIGGYDKYAGLTVEEISNGQLNPEKNHAETLLGFYKYLDGSGIILLAVVIISIIIAYAIYGAILNSLHRRMFGSTTALAYVPIANVYVAVKLAFGNLPAKIFIIAYLVAIPLSLIGIGVLILSILSIVSLAAFVLDIIKIITKRYDFLYYEPKTNNKLYNDQNNYVVNGSDSVGFGIKDAVGNQPPANENNVNQNATNNNGSLPSFFENNSNSINDSALNSPLENSNNQPNNNSADDLLNFSQGTSNNQSNNSNEGESDLSKFFN